jgi:lipopolysaccharide assembly protein A
MRTGLIAGTVALIVVMIFIIQNAHAANITFLGAHLHLSLAVALLLAAVAGALAMAAAGTARITQLRRVMRRNRRNPQAARTIPPGAARVLAGQAPDCIPAAQPAP